MSQSPSGAVPPGVGRIANPSYDSPGTPDRWLVLALVAGSYFTFYLHRNLINYLQRPLMTDLDLSAFKLGILHWAFLMPYTLAQIGVGYFGDRFRRRTVLLYSLAGSVLTLAAMGLAQDFADLLVLRVLLALAQSAAVPAMASAIADCFTPKTRSTAVGVYLASYNLALVVAGRYGGKVADILVWRVPLGALGLEDLEIAGWRMAMFLFAAAGGLAALLVLVMFREPRRTERVGGTGLGDRAAPLLPTLMAVLRVPSYLVIAAVFVLAGGVVQTTQFWLPRYLGDRFELSLEEAGWQATVWIQAATIAGLFLGGKLGDWWSGRRMAGRTAVQMIGVALLVPAVVVIGTAESLPLLAVPLMIYGFGIGLYQAHLWTTTFEVVDPAARATAVGWLNVASGVFGSWWNPLIGVYHDLGGELSTALAAMSVPATVSLLLLGLNVKYLVPRDYRGPLRKPTP